MGIEIEQHGGPKLVYQEPKARGEAWLDAIYRERPDLSEGMRTH